MKEWKVTSVGAYIDYIQSNFAYGYLYRGLSSADYDLVPAVGRYFSDFKKMGKTKQDLLLEEGDAFRVFYKEAKGSIGHEPSSYWEWLAIAQHHGTIHPDPTEPLRDGIVARVIIPRKFCFSIRHGLNIMGINRKSLFPDVDGLAAWIKWMKYESEIQYAGSAQQKNAADS